jgi:hypothetical protein
MLKKKQKVVASGKKCNMHITNITVSYTLLQEQNV